MISYATSVEAKPQLPNDDIIRLIGGHAGIARATAALVIRRGPAVVNSDPSDVFSFQEEILGESLNFDSLNSIEKDILSILSWVPQRSGDILREVIVEQHSIDASKFAEAISELIMACLVEVSGPNYLISNPVRALFRRKHGYGSKRLMRYFSSALSEVWERSRATDQIRTELLDAIAYMAAIEGGSLPPELQNLLLPSTLQEVVRATYDRGHDDPELLNRVVVWGLPALKINMDQTTREEILSYVVRAHVRLHNEKKSEELLTFFDRNGYRSRHYLRSFYERFHKRDMQAAVACLREAYRVKKYMGQVVGDLALCYQRLGWWPQLRELVREQERYISRNAVLLNVRIGMLIADGNFDDAEKAIKVLRTLPRQEVNADSRVATIMMRREHDFAGAQNMLTAILERGSGNSAPVRHLRSIAAASAGDVQTARRDADFLKARDRSYQTHDIEARIKLAQGDYDGAEAEIDKVAIKHARDELLRARILEAKAADPLTPFVDREQLRQRAATIRVQNRMLDEYEVES